MRKTVWVGLLLSLGLVTSGLTAQAVLPMAPEAQTEDLTPTPGFLNEPSIAVDPAHPAHLVAAWQINASAAWSRDGGDTWHTAMGTAPQDYKISGDVSVVYDARGHAILCTIAFDRLGTSNYWAHNATRNGIFIRRSLDGGKTWEKQLVPILVQTTHPGIPFEDKPYIVADTTHSRWRGNLYVGWTEFSLTRSQMLFSRSTDGGLHWSKPIVMSDHDGLPRDDNGAVEGFDGTVTPDGVLHVVWSDGDHLIYTVSRDGGRSFAPTRVVAETAPSYFQVADVDRANGFPQIGSDARGRLFVTWSDYRNGDIDVFLKHSEDGGKTWSAPVRVNDDSLHDGSDQFFQWLAVDPASGAVNVEFYDRRGDPENRRTLVTLARSVDHGRTFTNLQWSRRTFVSHGEFIGDYTGVTAYDGRVWGVWAEQVPGKDPDPNKNEDPRLRRTVVVVGRARFGRE